MCFFKLIFVLNISLCLLNCFIFSFSIIHQKKKRKKKRGKILKQTQCKFTSFLFCGLRSFLLFLCYFSDEEKFVSTSANDSLAFDITGCRSSHKYAIIVHGWRESCNSPWAKTLRSSKLKAFHLLFFVLLFFIIRNFFLFFFYF